MESYAPVQLVISGKVNRDFLVLNNGQASLDIPGGSLFYAASGCALWQSGIGLLARVGKDYPEAWLNDLTRRNLDWRGIRRLDDVIEHRRFIAYDDQNLPHYDNPVTYFARNNLPFPKPLLDYQYEAVSQVDSRTQLSQIAVRTGDIPSDYLDAVAAHLCPIDYLSHNLLPSVLRQGHISTLTLDPAAGYMNPTYWEAIPSLLTDLTAFLPNEEKIRSMFQGRSSDLWEMMEAISGYGCEIVVVKRGENGQYLYDALSHARYAIPAYPSKILDPTGAGDSFCGGFLAGYRSSYDPLQASLCGNISASFCVEGSGAFYAMNAMPRLAEARLLSLKDMVRRV